MQTKGSIHISKMPVIVALKHWPTPFSGTIFHFANQYHGWHVRLLSFARTSQSQLPAAYWALISPSLWTWCVYLWQQAQECFRAGLHATSTRTSVWHCNWRCQECFSDRPHYLQVILRVRQCVLAINTIQQTSNMTTRKDAVWTFGHLAPIWCSVFCSQVKRLVS